MKMNKLILLPFLFVLFSQSGFSQTDTIGSNKRYQDPKYILDFSKMKQPYNVDSVFGLSYYSEEPYYLKPGKFNPKQIYSLDFYHENSTFVSLDWSQFTELREARLNLNSFLSDKLSSLLSANPHLQVLTLYYNDTLPSCLCELKELTTLNLVTRAPESTATIFPACFGKLDSLKTLRFYGNNQSFDDSSAFWKPKNVEHLYLENVKNVDVSPVSDKLTSFWVQYNWSIRFSDKFFSSKNLEFLNIISFRRSYFSEHFNEKPVYPNDLILSSKFENFENLNGVSISGLDGQNFVPSFYKSNNLEYINLIIDSRVKSERIANKKQLKFFKFGSIDSDLGKNDFPLDSTSYSSLRVLSIYSGITDDFFPSYFFKSQQLNELDLSLLGISIQTEIKVLSIPSLNCVSPTRAEFMGKLSKNEKKRQALYTQKRCALEATYGYQLTKEFESHF